MSVASGLGDDIFYSRNVRAAIFRNSRSGNNETTLSTDGSVITGVEFADFDEQF
jgi:hypothetical protein